MNKLLKSWRFLRWAAFLIALGIDGYGFYLAQAGSPQSFLTSGVIAIVLFVVFTDIALHMRGNRRIRDELDNNEKITYQVGLHLIALLRNINGSQMARRAIWIPVALSVFATVLLIGWTIGSSYFEHSMPVRALNYLIHDKRYVFVLYIPLLFAIPAVLEYVSEWRRHQFVLVLNEAGQPRLHIHSGVFEFNLKTVALRSTVTIEVHQSFLESWVNIGLVELREKAGGVGERLEHVWAPRRLRKQIQHAISAPDGPGAG